MVSIFAGIGGALLVHGVAWPLHRDRPRLKAYLGWLVLSIWAVAGAWLLSGVAVARFELGAIALGIAWLLFMATALLFGVLYALVARWQDREPAWRQSLPAGAVDAGLLFLIFESALGGALFGPIVHLPVTTPEVTGSTLAALVMLLLARPWLDNRLDRL